MNPIETGKLIAKLRKEAGYTQVSLARKLNITDKAVSKWERGYGQPDTSLLPQIAKLLDCDMEILISGLNEYYNHEWTGLLILNNGETLPSTVIYDKPLIHYLLSYFLLVGITIIDIKANPIEYDYIQSLKLEQYGFHVSFSQTVRANMMIVDDKSFVFGANLTRIFQSFMSSESTNIIPMIDDQELPINFAHYCIDKAVIRKTAERRKMGRGMIHIPLHTMENVNECAEFIRIYQKYHNGKIGDLTEIAQKRGTI